MSHIDRIENPDLRERDDVKLVANDADTYAALAAVASSEGGQILLKNLARDTQAAIEKLASQFVTLPEAELRATCAKLAASLTLFKSMINAKDNLSGAQDALEELIRS